MAARDEHPFRSRSCVRICFGVVGVSFGVKEPFELSVVDAAICVTGQFTAMPCCAVLLLDV